MTRRIKRVPKRIYIVMETAGKKKTVGSQARTGDSFAALAGSAHSWPEDFGGENGCYENECLWCNTRFHGHKRRMVCKVCDTKARAKWAREGYNDQAHRPL